MLLYTYISRFSVNPQHQQKRKIRQSCRRNAVSNRFLSRFSTPLTNAPRLFSRVKAGTHSAFGERSHTAAHTAKQGPSLLRTQRGFAPPAKSPPKGKPEKTDAHQWRVSAFSGVAAPLGYAVLIVSQFTLYISAYRLCATLYLSVGYWRGLHDNRKATLYQKQQGVSLSMVMWCPL